MRNNSPELPAKIIVSGLLEPERKITRQEYNKVKKDLVACAVALGIGALLFCAPALIFMAAAVISIDESSASGIVTAVILLLGLGWCFMVCYTMFGNLSKDFDDLHLVKEKYLSGRTSVEKRQDNKVKYKRTIILLLILAVLIGVPFADKMIKESKADEIYVQAEDLIWNKRDYEGAIELLESIEINCKDKEPLIALCEAHIDYKKGYKVSAYRHMDDVYFGFQTDKNLEKIRRFKEILDDAYSDYWSEYLEEKYSISSDDDKKVTVESTTKYVPKYNGSSSNKYDDDPYDIDRYRNEEDFYYDNYDNFIDYYEAEKYFKEHKK